MRYNIHGDNIVECERVLNLILKSFNLSTKDITKVSGSPSCPELHFEYNKKKYVFTFYPGFGRWNQNLILAIRNMGGILREAADVIITKVSEINSYEEPIAAIEFCGALPAGNNAWQRSGRSLSFGKAKIPYFYVADIGGYELNAKREKIRVRTPNPAVPFSFLSFSEINSSITLPVYIKNSGISDEVNKFYSSVFGENDLIEILGKLIREEEYSKNILSLQKKTVDLIAKITESKKMKNTSLTSKEWVELFEHLKVNKELTSFLIKKAPMEWKKKTSIELTPRMPLLFKIASKYGVGITSSDLPFCLISKTKKSGFAQEVTRLYPELDKDFQKWLFKDEDLAICFITGFKPKGDDSRPDRGVLPLLKMLVGEKVDFLSIIYGPAPRYSLDKLEEQPELLIDNNGLWEVILNLSDGIIVDTLTNQKDYKKGFLRSHWERELIEPKNINIKIDPFPKKIGEQDVDTVLHTLFFHFGRDLVFEGLCNPPGGDWSGISIVSRSTKKELRWLSLPRVSGIEAKRPDHILQIHREGQKDLLLIIESKETATSLYKEGDIGNKLIRYVKDLICTTASVERDSSLISSEWAHTIDLFKEDDIEYVSSAAFLVKSKEAFTLSIGKVPCDILIGLKIGKEDVEFYLHSSSPIGKLAENYIREFSMKSHCYSVID